MSVLSKRVDKLSPASDRSGNNITVIFLNPGETHAEAISRSGYEGVNTEQCMFIEFVDAPVRSKAP